MSYDAGGAASLEGAPADDDARWNEAWPRLLRIALALGVPPSEAPDVVQDALLAAYRARRRFDARKGSFETWSATILVRRARNAARSRRRFAAWLRRAAPDAPAADPPGDRAVDARLTLERLVAALTPAQREVVALYEIADLSADEVAATLGITAAGVRSTARDARRALTAAAGRTTP